jgi:choline dehydrogenase-like flavoprotein
LGVTDGNGRLWGTQNVFIASSAIFPTSGQANPTLTMVALAVRQAEYISGIFHNEPHHA